MRSCLEEILNYLFAPNYNCYLFFHQLIRAEKSAERTSGTAFDDVAILSTSSKRFVIPALKQTLTQPTTINHGKQQQQQPYS